MGSFLWILMLYAMTTSASSFNSKEEMEELVESEQKLYRVLTNYTEHLEERMVLLKKYRDEFNKAFEDSSNGVEEYLDNPVNAFLFARRLLVTWKEVEKVMSGDVGRDWARDLQIQRYLKGVKLPSKDDMSFAALQVKKLQDTYQLNATQLAEGEVYGIVLNSGDCFELGREAYEAEDFDHANDWLQEAYSRIGDKCCKEADVLEYLAAVAYYKGRIRRALELTKKLLVVTPKDSKIKGNIEFYENRLIEISADRENSLRKDIIPGVANWQEEDLEDLHKRICNGSVNLSAKIQSNLKCRLTSKQDSYLILAPLKEEDAYLNPKIVLYHDLLNDQEIEELKFAAKSRIFPHEKAGKFSVRLAHLPNVGTGIVNKVEKKMKLLSGLDFKYSDLLNVLQYQQGGYEALQINDQVAGDPFIRKSGSKLASIRYFLDDSDGGATIFPALKLAIQPRKGSGLMWYNLKNSGQNDDLSLHGTCWVKSKEHWGKNIFVASFVCRGSQMGEKLWKRNKETMWIGKGTIMYSDSSAQHYGIVFNCWRLCATHDQNQRSKNLHLIDAIVYEAVP